VRFAVENSRLTKLKSIILTDHILPKEFLDGGGGYVGNRLFASTHSVKYSTTTTVKV
jgi:hypothetical protein